MSITLVQKSDLRNPKPNPKIALVLSGGAISGGAFKLGGLQALNRFMLNREIVDFDMYVGVSAGALISTYLANGVRLEEIAGGLEGRRGRFDPIRFSELYSLNYMDFLKIPGHLLGDIFTIPMKATLDFILANNLFRKDFRKVLADLAVSPSSENLQRFVRYCLTRKQLPENHPSLPWHYIPTGIFNTDRFERSTRKNLEKNDLCNDFKRLRETSGKELYIISMKLDTAERAVFGHDQIHTVPISKAMQASIAVPLFYKPVHIDGVDYIDGSVIKTTSMDIPIAKRADLILCYNPFRPFNHELFCENYRDERKRIRIAEDGVYAVLNQVMRTVLHTRLMHGMNLYRNDPGFKGDIILFEPSEYDDKFFDINPMAFWERRKAAKRGYESVKLSIRQNYETLRQIFNAHGISVDPRFAEDGSGHPGRVPDSSGSGTQRVRGLRCLSS